MLWLLGEKIFIEKIGDLDPRTVLVEQTFSKADLLNQIQTAGHY